MKGIDLEDIDFEVVYVNYINKDFIGASFNKGDTFNGISELKDYCDSQAETINGFYEVDAEGKNGDLISILFMGMNPYENGEGYLEDCYIEIKCKLSENAIPTIGDALD